MGATSHLIQMFFYLVININNKKNINNIEINWHKNYYNLFSNNRLPSFIEKKKKKKIGFRSESTQ